MIEDADPVKFLKTGVAITYFPSAMNNVPPPAKASASSALWNAGPSSVTPSPTAPKSRRLKTSVSAAKVFLLRHAKITHNPSRETIILVMVASLVLFGV